MARLVREGNRVHVLILAEGLTSRDDKRDRAAKLKELSSLAKTAQRAGQEIGVKSVDLLAFPDNRMDSIDRLDVIKVVERKIEEVQANTIFTHFGNDLNIDHRIANDAVVTACRPYPGQLVKEIYFFEVSSSTEWQIGQSGFAFYPNYFITLTEGDIEKKINALKIYESEMRAFPHSRSIIALEALAKWRGASMGYNAAEAFMLGRKID
ncbi:N-acetylglucosaminylphosphatidylinositol deacetylase [Leptospira noguchii str. Hook]|uniref:N-acetylglucosaminylphosphatidylinositol deacetylase n=2 Tax=Leptospira noguchii TaxID=28182 RepID=M6UJM2_9LEPT|nr:N-acetylglucosaminylphosphatidylinositol deacetylase [Leptospira noguchii serovar Autumnalis str. ZUN142]EMS88652.1 N-acetylglucosaminylphosphatidylinositol deacetylase [Leptospira noguchii str. Hook]